MASTPPPSNHKTGLSLLDDESPISTSSSPEASPSQSEHQFNNKRTSTLRGHHLDNDNKNKNERFLYEDILQQAATWQSQIEATRDELMVMQIQNAILLDELTMAGADA